METTGGADQASAARPGIITNTPKTHPQTPQAEAFLRRSRTPPNPHPAAPTFALSFRACRGI